MTSRNIAFMTGVLLLMLSGPVASQDWVDIKNPNELRALCSNKTFRSTFGGGPIVEHYRADGKGIFISGEIRTPRTWEVKGNDQVCFSSEKGTDCCRFQRNKKYPDEYVRRCTYDSEWGRELRVFMTILKVEDGIPEF
ncbi:MAG: DUF3990 domain-containing protein [Deltaproteobacteria bacterium]|nr:DUF3990 domain-containing protein [Deltaproteobacteria bacterium]